MKYLTTWQKNNLEPYILNRDGMNCFYCDTPFSLEIKELRRTFDHLDNNPAHNDKENLVLCHFKCNQLKKYYIDYQLKAQDKIRMNTSGFDALSVSVSRDREPKPTSKEIDINMAFYKITKDFINERILHNGKDALEFNDTIESVAYLMKESTNHGSTETAKRYIKMLCSSVAPYALIDQGGIWYIVQKKLVK